MTLEAWFEYLFIASRYLQLVVMACSVAGTSAAMWSFREAWRDLQEVRRERINGPRLMVSWLSVRTTAVTSILQVGFLATSIVVYNLPVYLDKVGMPHDLVVGISIRRYIVLGMVVLLTWANIASARDRRRLVEYLRGTEAHGGR